MATPAPSPRPFFLERASLAIATGYFAFAAVIPRDGVGFDICLFHRATALPCPGCGMTRGIGSLLRADAAAAWSWHPLSFVALPALLVAALLLVAPASLRDRLAAPIARHSRVANALVVGGFLALLFFGIARAVMVYLGVAPFPAG